jgi:tetratricopeptide (TPR) repeat protein
VRVQTSRLEAQLCQELEGGEIIGGRFGGDRTQVPSPRFLNHPEQQSRGQSLPAELEIHAKIDQPQDASQRVRPGGDRRDRRALVLRHQGNPFIGSGDDLLYREGLLIAQGMAMGALFPQRPRVHLPGSGQPLAAALDVEILRRFTRGVDVPDAAQIGCRHGADFHARKDIAPSAAGKPDFAFRILPYNFPMAQMTVTQAVQLAERCKAEGKLGEAESIYRQILAAAPKSAVILNHLGMVVGDANRLSEACDIFRQAVEAEPASFFAWSNLALINEKLEDFDQAIAARRKAIELQPEAAEEWHRLGVCFAKRGDVKRAIETLRKALELNPRTEGIRHDLILGLCKDDQHSAARELLFPEPPGKMPGAQTVKLVTDGMKTHGRFEEAVEIWRRVVELRPADGEARGQWAMCLITQGDYERGWREYEARWQCDTFEENLRLDPHRQWGVPPIGHPDVAGKTILLYSEQGVGDVIQFARYASAFAKRGARVILQCPWPLKALMETCAGVRLVYAEIEGLPSYDWHIPLMSLPLALGTTTQNIPADVPYLRVDPARCGIWESRVRSAAPGFGLRVGLAWAGNPKHKNDENRSIDPAALSKLAVVEGAAFFSLQKSKENKKAVPPPGLALLDFTQSLSDFAETAALIEQLDLVISVDTAVAHLAGALAKPVWTLIPFVPDFRWHLSGNETGWYPTMRLFRQQAYGNWTDVIERVVNALRAQVERKMGD